MADHVDAAAWPVPDGLPELLEHRPQQFAQRPSANGAFIEQRKPTGDDSTVVKEWAATQRRVNCREPTAARRLSTRWWSGSWSRRAKTTLIQAETINPALRGSRQTGMSHFLSARLKPEIETRMS